MKELTIIEKIGQTLIPYNGETNKTISREQLNTIEYHVGKVAFNSDSNQNVTIEYAGKLLPEHTLLTNEQIENDKVTRNTRNNITKFIDDECKSKKYFYSLGYMNGLQSTSKYNYAEGQQLRAWAGEVWKWYLDNIDNEHLMNDEYLKANAPQPNITSIKEG